MVPIFRSLLVLEKNTATATVNPNPNPSCCTIVCKTQRKGKNGKDRTEEKEDLQSNAGWKMGFCSEDNSVESEENENTKGRNGKRAVNGLAVNYYVNKAFAFWRAVAE